MLKVNIIFKAMQTCQYNLGQPMSQAIYRSCFPSLHFRLCMTVPAILQIQYNVFKCKFSNIDRDTYQYINKINSITATYNREQVFYCHNAGGQQNVKNDKRCYKICDQNISYVINRMTCEFYFIVFLRTIISHSLNSPVIDYGCQELY